MKYSIAVIPGDGIGPEIIDGTIEALKKIEKNFCHEFVFKKVLAGGHALDEVGIPLPQETMDVCIKSDSVLLGALGGPKWDGLDGELRPEKALLGLRRGLGLFANIRPVFLFKALKEACPLRSDITDKGIDICIVRELTGGIYFGPRGYRASAGGHEAYDTEVYSVSEIQRVARMAFHIAQSRRKKVSSVDKANILESSRLWRSVVQEMAREFPDIQVEHLYVDNAAMQLILNPQRFDVLLTTNMFGDILSDEASVAAGSIGMLPSASLGEGKLGLYEPVHGSAPDMAGQDVANPIATLLSAAMMLRYSLELSEGADLIEQAVRRVLEQDYRTLDIMSPGKKLVGTRRMTKLVLDAIDDLRESKSRQEILKYHRKKGE